MIRLLRTLALAPPKVRLDGPRVYLRPPRDRDWRACSALRAESRDFLQPWEPAWARDALSRPSYYRRVDQIVVEWRRDSSYAFHIFRAADEVLVGGITLSNIRRGVAQAGTLGYWIGQPHARRGFMTEAIGCIGRYGFQHLRLHRLEAACLPANAASCGLLAKTGFEEEGFARKYLRINGTWHDHVLFSLVSGEEGQVAIGRAELRARAVPL